MYVDQNDPEPRARVLFVADADPHARRVTESALLRRFAPDYRVVTAGWWRWARTTPLPFETSLPGVFAAGDVRYGSVKRVAGAVGEGSVAVGSVHQISGRAR